MLKSEYLQNEIVRRFVEWMSANLDKDTFAHSYENRRTGQQWCCTSLSDAFTKYHWPHKAIPRLGVPAGKTFATNAFALEALQKDLRNALDPKPSEAACLAAVDVMSWGGVRPGNARWLRANKQGLARLFIDTRNALNAGDTEHPALTADTLRFNAGMTKVYSLICDDFIIYDSRVGAALGWAVVKFCCANRREHVPSELRFPYAPAKEGKTQAVPKRRDPSEGGLLFPRLHSGPLHAAWNLRASWLLKAIIDHANAAVSQFKQVNGPGNPLRALEAALFMIGYDLPAEADEVMGQAAVPPPAEPPCAQATPDDPDEWKKCYTLKHGREFRYRITGSSIEVDDGPTFPDTRVNAALTVLWNHFGENPFPLANSGTAVRRGLAPMGFGKAYFDATRKNPPDTSTLAAVLEELDVIVPVDPRPARGLHWTLNANLLRLNSPGTPLNVRPLLDDEMRTQEEI